MIRRRIWHIRLNHRTLGSGNVSTRCQLQQFCVFIQRHACRRPGGTHHSYGALVVFRKKTPCVFCVSIFILYIHIDFASSKLCAFISLIILGLPVRLLSNDTLSAYLHNILVDMTPIFLKKKSEMKVHFVCFILAVTCRPS